MKEVNNTNAKKWGIGSLSLIISIFSIMFSFSSFGLKTIGETILTAIGVKFPIGIISIILFIIAIIIGYKYKEDFGAKLGKNLSVFFIILMLILTIN